jgi:hypothetical protein
MKYLRAAIAAFFIVSISMPAYSATEIRVIGGPGALNNGDILFGSGYWDSPGGRRVYRINTTMIPFASDNTVKVDDLYVLAAGATDGAPYVLSGTWTIDSNATFMSRHWSGSGDFLKYDGTRGAAGDTGVTTAILKGDGAGGFSDAVEGTDYVAPSGNVATATALAANPADCTGSDFAIGIDADGDAVCDTPSGVGDMLKSVYDTGANSIVDSAEALSAQYIDYSQSSGPTSIANKPTLGTISSQAASAVAITGGSINNTQIGNETPSSGEFTSADVSGATTLNTLATSGVSTFADNTTMADDKYRRSGSDGDWLCGFISASSQFKCTTTNDGSGMTDANGMYVFDVAVGGSLDDEQTIFDVMANSVSKFNVDQDGDAVFTGEVTAISFATPASDNVYYINVGNTADPAAPADGDCQYNMTTNLWKCYNGATWDSTLLESSSPTLTGAWNFGGATSVEVPNGDPTVDTTGEIGVDTTADQVEVMGSSTLRILDHRRTENATFQDPTSGDKAKWRKPYGMTVSAVECVVDAATSVVLDVQECNSNGASCSTILSSTITCGTTHGAGTVSDSAIAADNYVFFSLGTVTGTPGYLYVNFEYTVTGE